MNRHVAVVCGVGVAALGSLVATPAQAQQECMPCISYVDDHESPPGAFFVVWAWGGPECSPQTGDECARCENFEMSTQDCGEEGSVLFPDATVYIDQDSANAVHMGHSCSDARCHLDAPLEASLAMAQHIERLAASGRYAEIVQLVTYSKGALTVNESRSAIQLLDCTGSVSMHVPVDAVALQEVVYRLARAPAPEGGGLPFALGLMAVLVPFGVFGKRHIQ
jgi:hypothetical protein